MHAVLNLCRELPEQAFAAGELLIAEGGSDRRLYVLIEGEVEILKQGIPINSYSEPGAMFGELSILLNVPHTATVKAIAPCRTYTIEDGAAFLQSHPEFAVHLATLLAQKLNSITSYLADMKSQFADYQNHLGMVDEVLENLLNQQPRKLSPGSERCADLDL